MNSLQINTELGLAAFSCALSKNGKVTLVKCLSLELPVASLQLSYPNATPEELQEHFTIWATALPYLVETAIWLETPPDYLKDLAANFRARTDDYEALRQEVLATDPLDEQPAHPHWQRVSCWFRLGVQRAVANFPASRLRKESVFGAEKFSLPYRKYAADWLITSFPLVGARCIDDWITAIGKTRTTEGNEFLFHELERPGVSPFGRQIFTTLANSRLKLPAQRIVNLYDDEDKVRESVKAYIHLVNQLPFPEVKDLLLRIIEEHPHESFGAVKRFARHNIGETYAMLRGIFVSSEAYRTVMGILDHMVRLLSPEDYFLDLYAINERLTDPVLHQDAQVTWPQKLNEAWKEVLLITPEEDFITVINNFFPESKGPVARNILLQLRDYLSYHPTARLPLSESSERTLIASLDSRYDKISTVATDVIRMLFVQLRNPQLAVERLLNHIIISRYKIMDAAALREAAQVPRYHQLQVDFFKERIKAATDSKEIARLEKAVTYLRHLPRWEQLLPREEE